MCGYVHDSDVRGKQKRRGFREGNGWPSAGWTGSEPLKGSPRVMEKLLLPLIPLLRIQTICEYFTCPCPGRSTFLFNVSYASWAVSEQGPGT